MMNTLKVSFMVMELGGCGAVSECVEETLERDMVLMSGGSLGGRLWMEAMRV